MLGEILKKPDFGIPGFKFGGETKLGEVLSQLLIVIYFIATFLAFFWLVWGAFQYITAGGEKEKLAQARSRIIWAIAGLLIVLAAFMVAQFTQQILQPRGGSPIL
jgi:hypothetical protein